MSLLGTKNDNINHNWMGLVEVPRRSLTRLLFKHMRIQCGDHTALYYASGHATVFCAPALSTYESQGASGMPALLVT
jgi:hypothetical protein